MKRLSLTTLVIVLFFCGSMQANDVPSNYSNVHQRNVHGEMVQSERDEQEALYNYYFRERELTYKTKFDDLPREASVPNWRIPYSAEIHPESNGGMGSVRGNRGGGLFGRRRSQYASSGGSGALSVYDRAFNGGQNMANSFEIRRIMGQDSALFPAMRMRRNSEHWEGYCSGFTASTIRHPEPVRAVDAGTVGGTPGVVVQPHEIKALLSCIYNRTTNDSYLYLAPPSARDGGPNMGTFHLTLANYIGAAGHPVGIDRTKGRTSWNNPVYTYTVKSVKDAGEKNGITYKNLETTITYSFYGSDTTRQTDRESGDRVNNRRQSMTLRYTLALDAEGNIVGGAARNSAGHFLWIPLYAVQAGGVDQAQGNPHVDVRRVIALARASAMPEVQEKYDESVIGPRIDPTLVVNTEETETEENETDE